MRVDFSPFLEAGRANAAANASFGQALGQVAKGYIEGQEKKARSEEMTGYLMNQGVSEKDAKAISKNPFLQKEYQRKKASEAQMKMEEKRLANQANIASAGRAQRQAELDEGYRRQDAVKAETNAFYDRLNDLAPTDELTPGAQQRIDSFSSTTAPTDPRRLAQVNDPQAFMERVKNDPSSYVQKPVYELEGPDFYKQFEDPGMFQKALAFQQANQPKAQKIARTITMQDGKGGFTQVGVDEAGNPVTDFGPPKPSGMYPTPKEQAKGKEDILSVENANDFVNKTRVNSLDSAKSIRPATRALTLLEKGDLDTGGITELKTNTIAMLDSLGIPIDKETMDKVANTQNFRAEVGKFLFENISNTKGSISEKEMDIFAKISPGLQMTPEANKVLLKYVIKKAERDKDRVKFIQDMRRKGVGIVEQRNSLEDYMIEYDLSEVLSPIAGQPGAQSPQNTFNFNGQNIDVEIVGERKDGTPIYKDKKTGQILVQQPAQ